MFLRRQNSLQLIFNSLIIRAFLLETKSRLAIMKTCTGEHSLQLAMRKIVASRVQDGSRGVQNFERGIRLG